MPQSAKKEIEKTYSVPVSLLKSGTDEMSMGNAAIASTAEIKEQKDGSYKVYMTFKTLEKELGGNKLKGHLLGMTVNGKAVDVIDTYEENGKTYNKTVVFPLDALTNKVKASIEVDVMNALAGGVSKPQDVDIALDLSGTDLVIPVTQLLPVTQS